MNNKYINGMNEIKADDNLKRKIINSVKQNNSKQSSRFFALRKTTIAIVAACAFAIVIIFGVPYIGSKENNTKQGQSEVKTLFNGFTITAYAAGGTPFEIKPNVDFLLGKYQMTMSSVPGFPLKIVCNDADTIKLAVTDGEFLLWSPPSGQVHNKGKELEIKSGDTIYWTPLNETKTDVITANCAILIKAYKNNKELGNNTIKIESDKDYSYIGKLSE